METCCYYKDLDSTMQNKVNQQWRNLEFERRTTYYNGYTNELEYPWYFKTEYINSWTYPNIYLFDLCPVCGLPNVFSHTIKEVGYEIKTITAKCQCDNIYKYVA